MPGGAVARRYARAAFEIALDQKQPDAWLQSLGALAIGLSTPEVMAYLQSPSVQEEEKVRVVDQSLQDVDPLVRNLILLLLRRGRIDKIGGIVEEFRDLLNRHRGVLIAEVTTAVPLGDSERKQLAAQLSKETGKQIELHTKVDESLIGGAVVQIGDKIMDGSVRARLDEMRRRLTG